MVIAAYDPIIAEASRRFGVPEERIRAVMKVESGGQPWARSPKGAAGLMQIMPDTYAELAQRHGFGPDRFNPTNNIMAGTAYLGEMYDQFGNWDEATQAYNMGPGRAMKVRNGTATVPAETAAYGPKVNAVLASFSNGGQGGDVAPGLIRPQPGQTPNMGPLFGGPRVGSLTGLIQADEDKNYAEGLGLLGNFGQTPSQPPRTDPAALPNTSQTDRLDLSGRINEMISQLSAPGGRPQMPSQLQYLLGGMQQGVQGLTGVHDRPVGFGEIVGALGGGATQGFFAGNQAQFQDRANQFKELSGLTEMQKYQRGEATKEAQIVAARRYAAQLRESGNPDQIAMAEAIERDPSLMDNIIGKQAERAFPKPKAPRTVTTAEGVFVLNDDGSRGAYLGPPVPRGGNGGPPSTVDLGDGPEGPGVYARNPDGSLGPRLGASINAPGTEAGTGMLTPEQAQERGLPAPPQNSPYSNSNLSPKGRSNLVAANTARWEKRALANEEASKAAQTLVGQLGRFMLLNETNTTNGFVGSPLIGWFRGLGDAEFKEMQAITAAITPTLRQPGSGATSDFDAKMFQAGTVGVDKPKETNAAIAQGAMRGAQNLIAKAQFEQAYFDAYQHTTGMEAAWQRYLEANPIFDPTAPKGTYRLNPDENRQTWQEFFRNGEKPREKKAPDTSGNATVPPPPPGAVVVGP